MAYFSERKRLAEQEAREAAGEDLWAAVLPEPAREKITRVLEIYLDRQYPQEPLFDLVKKRITFSRGTTSIAGVADAWADIRKAVRVGDVAAVADVLEVSREACEEDRGSHDAEGLSGVINDILASHRVSLEFVDRQVVEFESREMHKGVVVPALTLLGGDPKFAAVESAYQDALKELATEKGAPDAITDAGRALQEMLEARGCKGNTIGKLLKSARAMGVLSASDEQLEQGISNIIDWVSADRNTKGDVHKASDATRADAWLTVHVVGALILRLANDEPRGPAA